MAYTKVFKRYELKYMLTTEQKEQLLKVMQPYMAIDKYGKTRIRNLYFDTDSYLLIRRSIEKPEYKEKLRIRSYQKAEPNSEVFVELKKKYDHVVYKRRISLPEKEAMDWLCNNKQTDKNGQIIKEIESFRERYENLHPVVFLSYDRQAYYMRDGEDFRVTFDDNIRCRRDDLNLEHKSGGDVILEEGKILMEIKCSGGIPLWMTRALSEHKIYKTSFSKYGTAYKKLIFPKLQEANCNVG